MSPSTPSKHSASLDNEDNRGGAVPPQCSSFPRNLTIVMFIGFSVVCGLHVNFSVIMVAMFPQYSWGSQTQGWLLGGFFFGQLCANVPGHLLGGYYGGRKLLGWSVLGTSALTLLTPQTAQDDPYILFVIRVLNGLGEGLTYPAMLAMWARWATPQSHSWLMSLSELGTDFGAIWAMLLTSFLYQGINWPTIFYICGGAGCIWAIVWFFFVSGDIDEAGTMTESLQSQGAAQGSFIPLHSVLLSVPLWIIITTQMCSDWCYYTLLTFLPSYMATVLKFDIRTIGLLSALPFLCAFLFAVLLRIAADNLKKWRIQKLFIVTCMLLSAVPLVALGYAGCRHSLSIALLTFAALATGTRISSVMEKQIAQRGFVLGISRTFSAIPGFMVPIVVGYITKDRTLQGWRKVFWLAFGINVSSALLLSSCCTSRNQPVVIEEESTAAERRRRRRRRADPSQHNPQMSSHKTKYLCRSSKVVIDGLVDEQTKEGGAEAERMTDTDAGLRKSPEGSTDVDVYVDAPSSPSRS
ncbi:sialin-like [Channa argus]|uniref:sialin-like n=1 Tax=Channa argus TaxID=215402 RepID=UPI003521EA25